MYREIAACRICGNTELVPILDLGIQALTGIFPRRTDEPVEQGPLQLVKCWSGTSSDHCGLVQLRHSFEPEQMYGANYGYRSGLNASMVKHLEDLAAKAKQHVHLAPGDVVLDIGSNDGTLLRALHEPGVQLVGMDPSANKFRQYYPDGATIVADFFSCRRFVKEMGSSRKPRIVTSIAMFYDLEAPLQFVKEVAEVLADDGVWVFEQSYLPTMVEATSYDTVCHEHVEYYGLRQILWLTSRAGLKIIAIELNDVNGGSFCITAAKQGSAHAEDLSGIRKILDKEKADGIEDLAYYAAFEQRTKDHKEQLLRTLENLKREGKKVLGYGASTKGNVTLQYCGLSPRDIPFIAEVNPDKFGAFTPGTLIPIISETEARAMQPDVFLVLPWHFQSSIVKREAKFLASGGKLLFPLPTITVI